MSARRGLDVEAGDLLVEPVDGFEPYREEWSRLALASGNVFLTPEWLTAWWETFGGGHELAISLVRRGDTPIAILPLYRDARPPSSLRMIGHTQSDLLGPVCAPEDRELAATAMREAIEAEPASLFVGSSLPIREGWGERLGGTTVDSITSPILDLEGRTWDEFLSGQSRNFRRKTRKAENRLKREFDATWRFATAESAGADLETLIALHRARWEGESGAFEGLWGELHRRFVPVAAERGWLRLRLLDLDGRTVYAYYHLRFGRAESAYQSGRDPDPELARYELGAIADAKAIREAIEAGLEEYRFLRGPEPYKDRYANRDDPVETVAVPLRLTARPLPALLRIAPRLPRPARRRLERLVS